MEVKDAAPPVGNTVIDRDTQHSSPSLSTNTHEQCIQRTSTLKGETVKFNATPLTQSNSTSQPILNKVIHVTQNVNLISSSGRYTLTKNSDEPDFILIKNFISDPHCLSIFNEIKSSKICKQHYTIFNGKQVKQPRLSSWHGPIPYNFSGQPMAPNKPDHFPSIVNLYDNLLAIDHNTYHFKKKPDSYLLNLYQHGNDSISEHKDNETCMDKDFPISSLSLGETRYLNIKSKKGGRIQCSIELSNGSLLIMLKGFQNYFHNIPKDSTRKPRISITFRLCTILNPRILITKANPPALESSNNTENEQDSRPSGKFWETDTKTNPSPVKQHSPNTPIKVINPTSLLKNNITTSPKQKPIDNVPTNNTSISDPPSKSHHSLPHSVFSLDTLLLCIENMRRSTLEEECKRNSISSSGNCTTLRKRLYDYIKATFRRKPTKPSSFTPGTSKPSHDRGYLSQYQCL